MAKKNIYFGSNINCYYEMFIQIESVKVPQVIIFCIVIFNTIDTVLRPVKNGYKNLSPNNDNRLEYK